MTEKLLVSPKLARRSGIANVNSHVKLSLLMMSSLAEVLPYASATFQSTDSTSSIGRVIRSQVCHIISASGKSVHEVTSQYFAGVHTWLPIVYARKIKTILLKPEHATDPDIWALVLAMHLINRRPSTASEVNQNDKLLYLATKNLIDQLCSLIPGSLRLVQASLLLSHYEHGQGQLDAAYMTVGSTARKACVLGMHTKQHSTSVMGAEQWLDDEEELATWWAIVVLDRYFRQFVPKLKF